MEFERQFEDETLRDIGAIAGGVIDEFGRGRAHIDARVDVMWNGQEGELAPFFVVKVADTHIGSIINERLYATFSELEWSAYDIFWRIDVEESESSAATE